MPKKAIDIICKSSYKSKNNEVCNWQNFEKIYIAKKKTFYYTISFIQYRQHGMPNAAIFEWMRRKKKEIENL